MNRNGNIFTPLLHPREPVDGPLLVIAQTTSAGRHGRSARRCAYAYADIGRVLRGTFLSGPISAGGVPVGFRI